MRAALAVLVALGGAAGAAPGVASRPVVGGQPGGEAAVVALVRQRLACGESPALHCSGTLVGERAVLTAAHCVEAGARGVLEVRFGGGGFGAVIGHAMHPSYARGDDFDVAVLWLERAAPVAPMGFAPPALDGALIGQSARVVGFGAAGGDAGIGERREGAVRVSDVTAAGVRYAPGPAGEMSCNGDSGGPLLVDGKLAGVIASGDRDCALFGVAARVDVAADFVRATLAGGPPATSAPPDVCAAEPDCGCGVGGPRGGLLGVLLVLAVVATIRLFKRS